MPLPGPLASQIAPQFGDPAVRIVPRDIDALHRDGAAIGTLAVERPFGGAMVAAGGEEIDRDGDIAGRREDPFQIGPALFRRLQRGWLTGSRAIAPGAKVER